VKPWFQIAVFGWASLASAQAALPMGAVRLSRALAPEPVAEMLRLPVATEGLEATGTSPPLHVIAGGGRIREEPDGAAWLEQSLADTSVVTSAQAKSIAMNSVISMREKTPLAWLVVDSRHRSGGRDWRAARPFLKLARAIHWDPVNSRHVAEFLLGLDAENGGNGPLAKPLRVRLTVSCDDVTPRDVYLSAVGPGGDQSIEVGCSRKVKNERERQSLNVAIGSGELDYPFEIPRRPGPFELVSSAQDVLGMGLGSLSLTVIHAEEDRTPMPVATPTDVPLKAVGGDVTPSRVVIPAGESQATVLLRPSGLGVVQLSAGASGLESKALAISLEWPLLFLWVTLIGGGLGGWLSVNWKPEQRATRRKFPHAARRVLEGSLVGLVMVGAFVSLPSVAIVPDALRNNELGWFVGSVLAGFVGTELVETLSNALLRRRTQTAIPV
jgi:hypothetical protein